MPAIAHDARCSAGGSTGSSSSSAPPPASSFFIIHEPDAISWSTASISTAPQDAAASPVKSKKTRKKLTASTASPLPTAQRCDPPGNEEGDAKQLAQHPPDLTLATSPQEGQGSPALSVLSRCGSAPDLPLHSSLSAAVYRSSAKRLQRASAVRGAHQVALQRSRLTPLPVDIRTGSVKRSLQGDQPAPRSVLPVEPQSPGRADDRAALELKARVADTEGVAKSLQQRLAEMERERSASTGARHALERQNRQLRQENQQLQLDKTALQRRADELAQQLLQCQHRLDKLTDRYATVYSGLQKLADKRQAASPSTSPSEQMVVQALARENQDLQRKLRVLEARHADDKALAANNDKKLKRLRAEMEAMQHMDASKADSPKSAAHSPLDTELPPSSLAQSMVAPPRSASRRVISDATASAAASRASGRAGDAPLSTPATQQRSSVAGTSASHVVSAEDYPFIDPTILKVLDKVDSQFSIANAISLSATLKKWLSSCLHVVCSTHVPAVLQAMLKRATELLHCEHAAVFHVDHGTKRLAALCSERGEESWELPLDKGILGYAARQNALCNVRRAYDDPRFYSPTDTITGLPSREVLCIPIAHEPPLSQTRGGGVLAVLQLWNTTHQKAFTANDQVLGSLLAIHVGAVVLQTKVGHLLLRANKKFHQIAELPHDVVAYAQSLASPCPSLGPGSGHASAGFAHIAAVDLIAAVEKKLAECLGTKHVRVFGLDAELMKIWQVGRAADSATGHATRVRKYANASSSLCALALHARDVLIVPEPTAEPSFNDMVDMPGGAGGLYLAAISSPWRSLPLGMVQVARSSRAGFASLSKSTGASRGEAKCPAELSEAGAAAAFARQRESEQRTEDALLMELIATFSRSFAGLLLHARAQQLHEECPPEVQQARLAILSDRLSWLEGEEQREQELLDMQVSTAECAASATSSMEHRVLDTIQRENIGSSHSRQSTPASLTLERPKSSNSPARVDTQPSASSPAPSSRRISSAGSPLRMRTPQPALPPSPDTLASDSTPSNTTGDRYRADERNVHGGEAGGDNRESDETDATPAACDEVTDGTSLLSLDPPSAIEMDSGSDPGDESAWGTGALFPASINGYASDIDHGAMETPEDLDDDDDDDASEPTELVTEESYVDASDDVDADVGGITAPGDDASSRTGPPTPTASSGLIATDSAYSIDLG